MNRWKKIFHSRTRKMIRSLRIVTNHFIVRAEKALSKGDDSVTEIYQRWGADPDYFIPAPYLFLPREDMKKAAGRLRKLLGREFGNDFIIRVTLSPDEIIIKVRRKIFLSK